MPTAYAVNPCNHGQRLTSRIINGGETNYVMATISLYLNIFNLFVSLLQLLGIARSDD